MTITSRIRFDDPSHTSSADKRLQFIESFGSIGKRSNSKNQHYWVLGNREGVILDLSLPKFTQVNLVPLLRIYDGKYQFQINGKSLREQHFRDSSISSSSPFTERPVDITSYVHEGHNEIKLTKTGGGTVISLDEIYVEITTPTELAESTSNPVSVSGDKNGIELVQSIQDWEHHVPLLEKKKTYARIYIEVPQAVVNVAKASDTNLSTTKITGEIKIVQGDKIYYVHSEGENLLKNINQNTRLKKRRSLKNSLNFILPDACTSGEIDVNLSSCTMHIGTSTHHKLRIATHPVRHKAFSTSYPLRLRVFGLRYTDRNSKKVQPRAIDYAVIKSWLNRAFPVSHVEYSTMVTDAKEGFTVPLEHKPDQPIVQVAAIRNLDMSHSSIDRRTIYYGLVLEQKGLTMQNGLNCGCTFMRGQAAELPPKADPTTISAGPTGIPAGRFKEGEDRISDDKDDKDGSYGDWYTAHELGHVLGRKHVLSARGEGGAEDYPTYPYKNGTTKATIGDATHQFIGLDVGDNLSVDGNEVRIDPLALPYDEWYDVMSYALPEWLSKYTYNAIRERLRQLDEMGASGSKTTDGAEVKYSTTNYINVVASRDEDTNGRKLSTYTIHYVNPLNGAFIPRVPIPQEKAGRFKVTINKASGSTPPTRTKWINEKIEFRGSSKQFVDAMIKKSDLALKSGESVKTIELMKRSETTTLASVTIPENVTAVNSLTIPTAFAGTANELDTTVKTKNITWTTTGGGTGVKFNVQVSKDNGTNWETLAVGLSAKSFTVVTDQFEDLSTTKIRIMATNGITAVYSSAKVLGSRTA